MLTCGHLNGGEGFDKLTKVSGCHILSRYRDDAPAGEHTAHRPAASRAERGSRYRARIGRTLAKPHHNAPGTCSLPKWMWAWVTGELRFEKVSV
jgi:hypothetical protein